jgi:FG-GAP repeat protein
MRETRESQVAGSLTRLSIAAAFLLYLLPVASAQERLYKWFGDQPRQFFGSSMVTPGDVTGDGIPDLLVGAPDANSQDGWIRAMSGADGSIAWTLDGGTSDTLGWSMESAGDADNDGVPDFFGTCANPPGGNPSGYGVTLYSGATRSALWTILGNANEAIGTQIKSMGDLDGDGVVDAAISEYAGSDLHVISGMTGSLLYLIQKPSDAYIFTGPIASGGDVDGDGFDDLVIGDSWAFPNSVTTGAAWVHSGKTGALLYELAGLQSYSQFGRAVALVDDLNQDGRSDVVVSAPNEQLTYKVPFGRVRVFSGKDGSALFDIGSNAFWQAGFGNQLAAAGDMNRDGFGDFLVQQNTGGELDDYYSIRSKVLLISGRDGSRIYHYFDPDCLQTGFGVHHLAPDLDGDGNPEVALANPNENDGSGTLPGSASLWRGDDLFVNALPRECFWYTHDVSLFVGQGIAGAPYALFLVDVNGSPVSQLLAAGTLDGGGRAKLTGWLPAGYRGTTFGLKAWSLGANSKLIDSGVETIYIK